VQSQFLHFDFYFPHRSTPVSTGCGGWRDFTRITFYIFVFFDKSFTTHTIRHIIYLTGSVQPNRGDMCGNYFDYLFSVAVLTVRRGRLHFLSFFI
jgi:hypothetical protein